MLKTIPNKYPHLNTRVKLTCPVARLCPVSGEPQPSSTITIIYEAGTLLLETKSLHSYLASFAGENRYNVRDLEETVQLIAQECANTLGVQVIAQAYYVLNSGLMEAEVLARPSR